MGIGSRLVFGGPGNQNSLEMEENRFCEGSGCLLFPLGIVLSLLFIISEVVVLKRLSHRVGIIQYKSIFLKGFEFLSCEGYISSSSSSSSSAATSHSIATTSDNSIRAPLRSAASAPNPDNIDAFSQTNQFSESLILQEPSFTSYRNETLRLHSVLDKVRLYFHVLLVFYFFLLFLLFSSTWSQPENGTASITFTCFVQLVGWIVATYVIDLVQNSGLRIGIIHRFWTLFEFIENSFLLLSVDDLDGGKKFYIVIGLFLLAGTTVTCFYVSVDERESLLALDEIALLRNTRMNGGIPLSYTENGAEHEEVDASNEYNAPSFQYIQQVSEIQGQENYTSNQSPESETPSNSSSPEFFAVNFDATRSRYAAASSAALVDYKDVDEPISNPELTPDNSKPSNEKHLGRENQINSNFAHNNQLGSVWDATASDDQDLSAGNSPSLNQSISIGDGSFARKDIPIVHPPSSFSKIVARQPLPKEVQVVSGKVDSWSSITTTAGESFVGYIFIIHTNSNDSFVSVKRYGECHSLNEKLQSLLDSTQSLLSKNRGNNSNFQISLPQFPSRRSIRKLISQQLNNISFLNDRARDLEIWLQGLINLLPLLNEVPVGNQFRALIYEFLQPLVLLPKSPVDRGAFENNENYQAQIEDAIKQGIMIRSLES